MNQLTLTYVHRVRTARKLGAEAADRCLAKAEERDPEFRAKALKFIVDFIRQEGTATGETATLAAVSSGIVAHDRRAFGAVYREAIRRDLIKVVGEARRVHGHGSRGGSVYAPGLAVM